MGIETPPPGDLAVGQLFLFRQDEEDRKRAKAIIREVLGELKFEILTFRSVPVINEALGARAESTRPWMEQVILRRTPEACNAGDEFERKLYLARKRMIHRAHDSGVQRLYVASLSSRTIVYKGLVLAQELEHCYPDLNDPDYKTAIAVFHQRYSTNTFPTWERAQPFRLICHNGEINTLEGNEHWMRAREGDLAHPNWEVTTEDTEGQTQRTERENTSVKPSVSSVVKDLLPIIGEGGSDSAKLDNVLELLVRSGRDIRHSLMMMVPEAWERLPEEEIRPERRTFTNITAA